MRAGSRRTKRRCNGSNSSPARPSMEGSVRTGLLFQLAAVWEKRADYDKAFALADEANAASRRLLRYDPKAHRQHCARIRHAFPKALYENRPGCGHETTLPVFVVGMPRSGTTLVEQIIAGHSRIHGAGELGVIPRVIAGLERWERHTGSGRRYPDCVDDLDPQVTRRIAENVLKELREYAPDGRSRGGQAAAQLREHRPDPIALPQSQDHFGAPRSARCRRLQLFHRLRRQTRRHGIRVRLRVDRRAARGSQPADAALAARVPRGNSRDSIRRRRR